MLNDSDSIETVAHLGRLTTNLNPVIVTSSDGRPVLNLIAHPNDVTVEHIDVERYADNPFRRDGRVRFSEPAGFVDYVNRHRTAATTLWSDRDHGTVTAVIDDHEAVIPDPTAPAEKGKPGWGRHVAVLTVATTPAWDHWKRKDQRSMTQVEFAEHIEDGSANLHDPAPAVFLEVAQSLQAHTGVVFKQGQRLDNGQTRLQYEETVTAKAGETGNVEIPSKFILRIAPYQGIAPFLIDASFRYRISGPQLQMHYKLDNPDRVLELAFADVLSLISTGYTVDDAIAADGGAPVATAAKPNVDLPIWAGVSRVG